MFHIAKMVLFCVPVSGLVTVRTHESGYVLCRWTPVTFLISNGGGNIDRVSIREIDLGWRDFCRFALRRRGKGGKRITMFHTGITRLYKL